MRISSSDIRDIYGNKVFGDNPSLAKCKATADFDGDGLKNYEEIGGIIQVDHVFTVWYTSDPTKKDTDGDGIDDGKDIRKLKPAIELSDFDEVCNNYVLSDQTGLRGINGIGLSGYTIYYGRNADLDDVRMIVALNEAEKIGYKNNIILDFVDSYRNAKCSASVIEKGKTISYYTKMENITDRLNKTILRAEYMHPTVFFSIYHVEKGSLAAMLDFKSAVQAKGDLDLKLKPEWQNSSLYIYNGEIVDRDAPGNICYGYIGKAYGIDDLTLLAAAGYAQIQVGTTMDKYEDTLLLYFGDDPIDQDNIKRGLDLYNAWHK